LTRRCRGSRYWTFPGYWQARGAHKIWRISAPRSQRSNTRSGATIRVAGPPYLEAPGTAERMSAYFICCNRGKRSVAVDYSTPEGAATIRSLALEADVLVENYKVGTLKRYGLDYHSLKALNSRLIYVSITGFGQDGPMADKPGYDYVFQGMGGLMSYTGLPDGQAGAGPLRTGVAVVDLTTGMYATSAVWRPCSSALPAAWEHTWTLPCLM